MNNLKLSSKNIPNFTFLIKYLLSIIKKGKLNGQQQFYSKRINHKNCK